jgi:glycogen debranching enzyme
MLEMVPTRSEAALDPHAPLRVLHHGYTVVVMRPDGSFGDDPRTGLFDHDTRVLSRHRLRLGSEAPRYAGAYHPESDRYTVWLHLPRPGGTPAGPLLPQDAIALRLVRRVGRGMCERIEIRNHSAVPLRSVLVLELDVDFADVQAPDDPRLAMHVASHWDAARAALVLAARGEHEGLALERALRVRALAADSPPRYENRSLHFPVDLAGGALWKATLAYEPCVDGVWGEPAEDPEAPDAERERWRRSRTTVESSSAVLDRAFARAVEDLYALRNHELESSAGAWVVNAGIPRYTGLFGRDALTAGWQAALAGPEMLRGAIGRIAESQAVDDVAWRDAEPGKLVHEMRRGPLSELELIPQRAYYGTQTTSAMFPVMLSELWHWTGETELLLRHRDTALRALAWAERYGDLDGDGWLEYRKRSPHGLKNQGWKDSDEAIRYADGAIVPNPITMIEEQAFYVLALERMAETLVVLEDEEGAERCLERARRLAARFDDTFWNEEQRFYAMALDGEKRQVRSIGSNAGHVLAAGLVSAEHARAVVERLLAPDLFSGWGIRTLSTEHPSYNPWSYHLGSVWPVENVTFALGMKRYGFDVQAEQLVTALFAAAGHFRELRLPEALGGHAADDVPVPSIYPGSNSPQAWSASALVMAVQVLLGLYPFAAARTLALVRPRLPEWLDRLTLRNVRVGDAAISLRFDRESDGSASHRVLERTGTLHVLTAPPPDASPRGPVESVQSWLFAHAPGRLGRALRIALGRLEAA